MRGVRTNTIAIALLALSATPAAIRAAEQSSQAASPSVVIMDNQGRVLRTVAPEPTRDQLATKAAEAERVRATAKADEEQKRKDRILLDSYTTESEIDLARNRATAALDAQMDIARTYAVTLGKQRDEIAKRKADGGNRPLPPGDEQELARLQLEIEQQNILLSQRKQDLERVVARYGADKRRWQELSGKQATPSSLATSPGSGK